MLLFKNIWNTKNNHMAHLCRKQRWAEGRNQYGGVSFNVRFCFINNTTLKQKSLFKMALLNNGQPSFLIIKYLGIFARGVFVYHCCCVWIKSTGLGILDLFFFDHRIFFFSWRIIENVLFSAVQQCESIVTVRISPPS